MYWVMAMLRYDVSILWVVLALSVYERYDAAVEVRCKKTHAQKLHNRPMFDLAGWMLGWIREFWAGGCLGALRLQLLDDGHRCGRLALPDVCGGHDARGVGKHGEYAGRSEEYDRESVSARARRRAWADAQADEGTTDTAQACGGGEWDSALPSALGVWG